MKKLLQISIALLVMTFSWSQSAFASLDEVCKESAVNSTLICGSDEFQSGTVAKWYCDRWAKKTNLEKGDDVTLAAICSEDTLLYRKRNGKPNPTLEQCSTAMKVAINRNLDIVQREITAGMAEMYLRTGDQAWITAFEASVDGFDPYITVKSMPVEFQDVLLAKNPEIWTFLALKQAQPTMNICEKALELEASGITDSVISFSTTTITYGGFKAPLVCQK